MFSMMFSLMEFVMNVCLLPIAMIWGVVASIGVLFIPVIIVIVLRKWWKEDKKTKKKKNESEVIIDEL